MPTELAAHTGYLLRALSNHVTANFSARLATRETTVAEWVLLRELSDAEGLPPSQIARRMGLTRGGVTKLADRLIARGLIRRDANPADGRGQHLALTPAGRCLVPELADLADQNDAKMFDHLSPADRDRLNRLLGDLIRHHGLDTAPID